MIKFKPLTEAHEWAWFKQRTPVIMCEDSQGIVAFNERGIQAVCVADSFSTDACNVHFAIDNPIVIRRGFLNEIARHLFVVRKRNRIFGLVPDNNEKALKLDRHIGFTEVARVPQALSKDIGYVVMVMTKEECPWLPAELREAA